MDMRSFIFFILLITILSKAKAYDTKNIYYSQLKNNAKMVVLNDTSKKDVTLNLYLKLSPAIENKFNAGISKVLCYLILNNLVKLDSNYANTKLYFDDEYSVFKFTLPNKEIEIRAYNQ